MKKSTLNRRKQNQKIHTKRRAIERLGIVLTNEDLYNIGLKIKKGDSKFITKYSNIKKVHIVNYEGIDLKVVWDSKRHQIATILKMEME